MLTKIIKYYLQGYFLKICLAVAVISAIVAFSGILVLALIFYYHYQPLLPLLLLAIFWLLMIVVICVCCFVSKHKCRMEMAKLLSICDRARLLLVLASWVKGLFDRKSK